MAGFNRVKTEIVQNLAFGMRVNLTKLGPQDEGEDIPIFGVYLSGFTVPSKYYSGHVYLR